jgi:anti-sigma factor RsiW
MYAEAYLRGAALTAAFQATREHLVACPTCAAEFGQLLALYTWREAQEPFNAGSLPLAAMRSPVHTRSIP